MFIKTTCATGLSLLLFGLQTPQDGITASEPGLSPDVNPRTELPLPEPELDGKQGGLAWADYNRDGLDDVFVVDRAGARLLRRSTDAFVDATSAAGLAPLPRGVFGGLWGDFDRDGDLDLFVVAGSNSALFQQEQGSFLDVTAASGLAGADVLAGRWRDRNADGWLDLEGVGPQGSFVLQNEATLFRELGVAGPGAGAVAVASGGRGNPVDASEGLDGASGEASVRPSERGSGGFGASGGRLEAVPSATTPEPGPPAMMAGGPLPTGVSCVAKVVDAAGGSCIEASRVPVLDSLLPIGIDWFVEAGTGFVGLGTTTPACELDIRAGFAAATYQDFLDNEDIVVSAQDAGLALISDLNGKGSFMTLKEIGSTNTNWGIHRTQSSYSGGIPHSEFHITYGTDEEPEQNTTFLRIEETDANDPAVVVGSMEPDGVSHLFVGGSDTNSKVTIAPSLGNGNSTLKFGEGPNGNNGFEWTYDGNVNRLELNTIVSGTLSSEPAIYIDRNTSDVTFTEQVSCGVLEITGGSDLVEAFDSPEAAPEPGTVMVIDPERHGELVRSSRPYDSRVAGAVSGAGGVHPGIQLRQEGVLDGDVLVAMTGRIYVRCNAENGAIRPGDLLTTSSRAGEAMRATDTERSFGAVLGKAMSGLQDGSGLVLVLVNLQ